MNTKSVEEKVEDVVKQFFNKKEIKYFCKTESINKDIDEALKVSLSKSLNDGPNFPDVKLLIDDLPIMIEVKGRPEDFLKIDIQKPGHFLMTPQAVTRYALNGAIHYASCIVSQSKYEKCIAIGITGGEAPTKDLIISTGAYLILRDEEPIKLSFNSLESFDSMIEKVKEYEKEKVNKTSYSQES